MEGSALRVVDAAMFVVQEDRTLKSPRRQRSDRLVGEFLAFTLIIFSAGWGSVFLAAYLKRFSRKLKSRPDDPLIEELREENQQLETRLARLEEEFRFYQELHEPERPAQLRPPHANDT